MAEKTPKKPTRVPRPKITPADATMDEVDEAALVVKRPDRDPMAETPIIVSADQPQTQLAHLQQRLRHEKQMLLHHSSLAASEIHMTETYGLRVNRLYGEIARLNGIDPQIADAGVAEMDKQTKAHTLAQMVELQNKKQEHDHG